MGQRKTYYLHIKESIRTIGCPDKILFYVFPWGYLLGEIDGLAE